MTPNAPEHDPRSGGPDAPGMADLPELARAVAEARSVRRVFGEPYERDGVLVVPVAKVVGWQGLARAAGAGRYGFRRPGPGGRGEGGGRSGGAAQDRASDQAQDHAEDQASDRATDETLDGGDPAEAVGGTTGGAGADGPRPGRFGGPSGHGPSGRPPFEGPRFEHRAFGHPPFEGPRSGHPPFGHPPFGGLPFGGLQGAAHGRGRGWAGAGSAADRTKPLGVYVIDDAGVHWRPALDLNRVILGGQAVGAVAIVALAAVLSRRRRR
ncbi:MAG TPA: hypothetical protein VGC67_01265 [Cellulomonas sp.]